VKLDAVLADGPMAAAQQAEQAEADGYAGFFVPEGPHDGFLPLAIAADHTQTIELGTEIAVAFSRTPMTLAHLGHDLQLISGGRFVLGLGSQIKPHIERRYSMPWSQPAARMRELVEAIRAIWRCWNEGEQLSFKGDFYTHTLMTPMFSPPASPAGPPRIWIAAVGPRMTRVAGQVADGILCHPLLSQRYLTESLKPALQEGAASAQRDLSQVEVAAMVMVATGEDEAALAQAVSLTKMQIAFYASTPAYVPVLALHGWEALQPELARLSKLGEWGKMGDLIDDEMVRTFAIVAPPDRVTAEVENRFGGLVDRVSLTMGLKPARPIMAAIAATFNPKRPSVP
jgi:probable F420-dependent oxidoreductase